MYKIKIYKNGKLFAEYDLNEYLLMDQEGKSFVSTGEDPQMFIMKAIRKAMDDGEGGTDVLEPPQQKERKTPTLKDKMALKHIIGKMDKEDH